jgi:3-oxoacyl-[acyl-carrier protein] reductase
VTGGSKGIGRAIADALADEGCHVAICARDEGEVKAAVAELKKKGVNASGAAFNVRDKEALDAWVKKSGETLGGIDIAVANVSALDMERGESAWKNEFEIDMMHTVRTVEAALPWIEISDAGSVLLISSVSGLEFDFTSPAYGTIKAALIHYASRMASTLAAKHIRVNTVSPGNTYFEGGVWHKIGQSFTLAPAAVVTLGKWAARPRPEWCRAGRSRVVRRTEDSLGSWIRDRPACRRGRTASARAASAPSRGLYAVAPGPRRSSPDANAARSDGSPPSARGLQTRLSAGFH